MKSKHQTEVIPAIDAIITEAMILKIRLLIEIELSGKLWIYCDNHNKRTVLKLLRQYKVRNPKQISAGGYDVRFERIFPEYTLLGYDKGKNVQKLSHRRELEYDTIGERKVYFFDCTADQKLDAMTIAHEKKVIISELLKSWHPEMTVNFDGDDVILFYGK